jgi:hypothetical protein
MPAGTTLSTQVTNNVVPARERPNKTPIFVSWATDTRDFLISLRALRPSSFSPNIKGERVMFVLGMANGFRATVRALRSLDGSKGVSFHTFFLLYASPI